MNEEIIFKWDREKIESQLEDVFEKVGRQKVNVTTVDCPKSTKICLICWKCSYNRVKIINLKL